MLYIPGYILLHEESKSHPSCNTIDIYLFFDFLFLESVNMHSYCHLEHNESLSYLDLSFVQLLKTHIQILGTYFVNKLFLICLYILF